MLLFLISLIDEENDKALVTDLFDNYEKQMWYTAYEIVKDKYLAEDCVQNAFMGIIKNLETVRHLETAHIRAYLLKSAKNSALDIIKKTKKEVIEPYMNEKDNNTTEDILRIDNEKYLVYLIKKLPSIYIDALIYRYVYDESEKEIARKLHINVNTVRQRIFRGKNLFKEIYEEEKAKLDAIQS